MPQQRGRNAGLTGLIDVVGTPKFNVNVFAFEETLGVTPLPVEGRGDTDAWVPTMAIRPGGKLVISGNAQFRQPPLPAQFRGQAGSVSIQFHEAAKQTVPIRVDSASIKLDKDTQDTWKITLVATITGDPSQTGFNSAAPTADPIPTINKETFEGLTKTLDPKGLLSGGSRSFFIAPIDNTDDAEAQALATAIAAAVAPLPGLKLKTAALAPGRTFNTAVLTLTYALTDSEEDVVNPTTVTTIDPEGLESTATATGVFSEPVAPSGDNFVLRGRATKELNDGAKQTDETYGKRSTKQDITMPGTFTTVDPLGLDSVGKQTDVYPSTAQPPAANVPSGLQLTGTTTRDENVDHKRVERDFEDLNSEQKRGFPKQETTDDAQNVDDSAVRYKFYDHGQSPPNAPDDPPANNVKLVHVQDFRVGSTRDMRLFVYGAKNSRDELVLEHVETVADPSGLESTAVRAGLDGETIADPVGYVYRTTKTVPVTDGLAINRTLTIKFYGLRSTQDDEEMPGTQVVTDPLAIDSGGKQTLVFDAGGAAPAAPTIQIPPDAKVVRAYVEQLNRKKSKKVFELGMRNTREEIEWLQSNEVPEVSGIASKYVAAVVRANDTVNPPAPPAADVTHVATDVHRITDSLYVHLYHFGTFTAAEEIEAEETYTLTDVGHLDDDGAVTQVTANATPPTPPAAPIAGQVLVSTRSRKRGRAKWSHAFKFDWRDSQGKLTASKTNATIDPLGLEDEQFTAVIYTGIAPNDPSPPAGNLQLHDKQPLPTANPAFTLLVYHWTVLTSEQQRTFPKISTTTDANNIDCGAIRAQFWTVGQTAPATPTDAPTGNVKLITSADFPHTPQKNMRVWIYGPANTADKLILPNYETNTDSSGLESTAVRAALDGDAITDPAGLPLRFTKAVPVTIGLATNRTLTIKVYGVRTTKQDLEFLQSKLITEAGNLEQGAIVLRVQASATPDPTGLNPDQTNLSQYTVETHQLTSGQWAHVFHFEPLTPREKYAAEFEVDVIDPSAIEDENTKVLFGSTPAPAAAPVVAGKVVYQTKVKRAGKALYAYIYSYRFRTAGDWLAASKARTLTDPDGLNDEVVAPSLIPAAAPPADPTHPTLKLVDKEDLQTLNPAYILRLYRFGHVTSAEKIVNENTWTALDPAGLESQQQKAAFNAPATLDSGFVPREVRTQEINDDMVLHTVKGGTRSTAQDRTFEKSSDTVDASGIKDVLVVTTIDNSATAPGTTVTGYQLRTTVTQQLTNAGEFEHTQTYGRATIEEELRYEGSEKTTSDDKLGDRWVIKLIHPTDAAAPPGATLNGKALVLRTTASKQLTTASGSYTGRWEYTYTYARNSLKDELERGGTIRVWTPWADVTKTDVTVQNDPADTRDLDTRIAAARALYKTDVTVDEVQIRQIDNVSFEQTIKRITEYADARVRDVQAYREPRNTFLGAYFGEGGVVIKEVVAVYVSQVVAVGAGLFMVLCTPQVVWGYRGRLTITKKLVTSVLPFHPTYFNTCNDSPWRGFPRRLVTFEGSEFQARGTASMAYPHAVIEEQKFLFDTQSFGDEAGVIVGTPFPWPFHPGFGFKDVALFGWAAKLTATSDYNIGFPTNAPA